jgi:hypothetical protein
LVRHTAGYVFRLRVDRQKDSKPLMFSKILIANDGEIACRVIRAEHGGHE